MKMLTDKLTRYNVKELHNQIYPQLANKIDYRSFRYRFRFNARTTIVNTSSYLLLLIQLHDLLEIQITSDLNVTKIN